MTSFRFHITLLLTIGLVFAVDFSQAADITTNKSGDWNAPSTWKGGTVPSPNDNVTIRAKVTLSSNQSCASLTVATDGTLNITTSSTLTINGDFSNSGTFSAGTGTVIFSGGNFSNSGTFSAGTGTVIFSGAIPQSITGATTFASLTINNAKGVTLKNNETVNGTLSLTNGIITTGTNALTISSTGSISGASSTSYVDGILAQVYSISGGSKTFPIGKGGNYRPLTLNYTTTLNNPSTVTVEQIESSLPGSLPANTTLFTARYWKISQTGATNSYAFNVTLDGSGFSPYKTINVRMLKGNGITNNNYPTTFSSPNYTATAFNSFGNFGLGVSENYWTGTTSNSWFTSTNWSTNSVPDGTGTFIIPSSLTKYPVILNTGSNVTISNTGTMVVQDGASLMLQAGPLVTLASGSTVTTLGSGKIIIESDGRYLNLSNNTPRLQIKRSLANTNKGWRMISAPVATTYSDIFATPLITQGFTGSTYPTLQPNLLWWAENDGGTTLQAWRTPASTNISPGLGHFFYIFNGAGRLNLDGTPSGQNYTDVLPITMSATGIDNSMQSGSFSYTITKTARTTGTSTSTTDVTAYAANEGWNLIGNPTASALDWNAASGWTKTNLDNSIYIWDPTANNGNGEYLTWNGTTGTLGSGRIAPFQSFWVRANAASPGLSFTNNAKTATSGTFLKSAQTNKVVSVPLTLRYGGMATTSFVCLSDNGIIGSDPWDAYRLEPMNDTWLALYTNSSVSYKDPLIINNLPLNEAENLNIPLYIVANKAGSPVGGDMTLTWTIPDNWPSELVIELMDHQQQKAISMLTQNEYHFTHVATKRATVQSYNPLDMPSILVQPTSQPNELKSTTISPYSIVIHKGDKNITPVYEGLKAELLPLEPNPFGQYTSLRFRLPEKASVRIDVIDQYGRLLETPVLGEYIAGLTQINWTPQSRFTGVCIIRMISGTNVSTQKGLRVWK